MFLLIWIPNPSLRVLCHTPWPTENDPYHYILLLIHRMFCLIGLSTCVQKFESLVTRSQVLPSRPIFLGFLSFMGFLRRMKAHRGLSDHSILVGCCFHMVELHGMESNMIFIMNTGRICWIITFNTQQPDPHHYLDTQKLFFFL